MDNPNHKPHFWNPWRRHWLFVLVLLIGGPTIGRILLGDRGLLFGIVVSLLAVAWLSWADYERHRQHP